MRLKIILLISGFLIFKLNSQIIEDQIQNAVVKYNYMKIYEDKLKPSKVTEENFDSLIFMKNNIEVLFNDALNNGTEMQKKVARYFLMNSKYLLGFAYGKNGNNANAYSILKPLENEMTFFSNSYNYPLKYLYFGKNYAINYSNFNPVLTEYYTGMGEICSNLSKNDESIVWSRKAINSNDINIWFKYISLNKIMEVKKKTLIFDKEYLDAAIKQLDVLTQLDTSYLRVIKELNYPTEKTSYKTIKTIYEKSPELITADIFIQVTPFLIKRQNKDFIMDAYTHALHLNGAKNNKQFLLDAINYLMNNEGECTYCNSLFKRGLILKAADFLFDYYNSNYTYCNEWYNLSEIYKKLSESIKAEKAINKFKDCENKKKEEDKKRQKLARKNSRHGLPVYLGTYPFPFLWGNYSGKISLMLKKTWIDFSYTQVNKEKDNVSDFNNVIDKVDPLTSRTPTSREEVYWDGSRIQLAFKFVKREQRGSYTYFGLMGGLINKKIQSFSTTVANATNQAHVASINISPEIKKYTLSFVFGNRLIGKGRFVMDMGMGIGYAYSFMNINSIYWNDEKYIIESNFVQNAKKQGGGIAAFFNLSMGFIIGKNNF